ncbi:MAG TPA: TRAP transporter substrate-binding protein DctP [Thermoanaerobaculia bacterium]|nr:TRAP transporter substrate-binding protein DctP [Thermoanaerobaculia bacterium]
MSQPAPSRSPVRTAMALALACCLLAAAAGAQKIKMATLSPEGSPWDTILKKMGEQWEQGTGGRVGLTIYPGGVAGDEPDIIRKMKIGQYQAAALSVAGLADIDEYFTVFEIPLFFDSYPEMRSVLETLTPTLTGRLEAKGFQLLGWGYVGWVYFFTAKPVTALEDLQALKIFTWAGDEAMVRWWRRNGFRPVSLSATDILTGLETGMIEAISVPPLYAMQMQYYKQAPYMADLGLAPMMGAIVMSKRGFDRISAADQKVVLAAAQEASTKVLEQIPKLDETAVKLMQSQGLEVTQVRDSQHSKEWLEAAVRFASDMRGTIVPIPVFDEALAARDAYRAQHGGGSP